MAATVEKLIYGSWRTLLSTELNSLANNGLTALSAAFDNTVGNTPGAAAEDGYPLCDVEFVWNAPGGTFAAGSALTFWFIGLGSDAATYGYSAATPPGLSFAVPVPAINTANRQIVYDVPLPPGTFKILAKNETGQTLGATGSTLKIRAKTREAV